MNLLSKLLLLLALCLSVPGLASANSIAIESPAAGTVIKAGTPLYITWTSDGEIPFVNVDLSSDDGATWRRLATLLYNDGQYSCLIPYITAPACRVRVSDVSGSATDVSDRFSFLAGVLTIRPATIDSTDHFALYGQERAVDVWLFNTGEALVLLNSSRVTKSTYPQTDWLAVDPPSLALIWPGDSLHFPVVINKGGVFVSDAQLEASIQFAYNAATETTAVAINTAVRSDNRPPQLAHVDSQSAAEGSSLIFSVYATDPDGTIPTLGVTDMPPGATFVDYGNGTALFQWEIGYAAARTYHTTFHASDGLLQSETTITITVTNTNRPPELVGVTQRYVSALKTLAFDVTTSDPDGDLVIITMANLPANASFEDHENGTGSFSFSPTAGQAGDHRIVVTATDGFAVVGTMFTVSVDPATPMSVTSCAACSPPSPFGDILVTDPIILTFSHALNEQSLASHVLITSRRIGQMLYAYDPASRSLIVTQAHGRHFPNDTINILVSAGLTSHTEEILTTSYVGTVFTGPIVYPGDLDDNGVVDERDILPIGAYFGKDGPARQTLGGADPAAEPAHRWGKVAMTYADADGSGTIDLDDICPISEHFGWRRSDNPGSDPLAGDSTAGMNNQIRVGQMLSALVNCPESAGKQALLAALSGSGSATDLSLPATTEVFANYPNPFNPTTTIAFQLAAPAHVRLILFNVLGQNVRVLVDEFRPAGSAEVEWDGRDQFGAAVASGIYFYRFEAGDVHESRSMLLLK